VDSSEKLDLKAVVAMGVGGMVGGGIFSVLGLAMGISGHAAPVVFAIGGVIALFTGMSYAKLGAAFHSAGGSFTYIEHAFTNRNVAGIAGWLLLGGYVGTLALYSYTFGAYGSAMLGGEAGHHAVMHRVLASLIMLIFLGVNLYGVGAAGSSEVLIVFVKVAILMLFGVVGLFYVQSENVLPVFNVGAGGAVIAAALIFVAYEGFELIPNSINDMRNPSRDLGRGIIISILIAVTIYVLVAFVAVGNLTADQVKEHGEYALAVAAQPFLGRGGFVLISLAALLSTASAINATLFGTARLGMVMAQEHELPKVFSFRERRVDIPWVSLAIITGATLVFVNTADLGIISSFASSTFLLIFAVINFSAFRLRKKIGSGATMPLLGCAMAAGALGVLFWHISQEAAHSLWIIGGFYVVTISAELLFSERRLLFRRSPQT
jgi:hypothetical protein